MDGREALNSFGKVLIERARDETIEKWFTVLDGFAKAPDYVALFETYSKLDKDARTFVRSIVAQVVDSTLFNTLVMLEGERKLDLIWLDGVDAFHLREESDGLGGELFSEEGWIALNSRFGVSD
jgi:hypothetical protein